MGLDIATIMAGSSPVKIPLDPNQPFLEAVQETFAACAAVHAQRPKAQHSEHQYGPHPRQKLDLFSGAGAGRPLVVFVHGGGFDRGDKSMYANVGTFFVDKGYTAANINYRLVGEHGAKYPSGGEDIGLALQWLSSHESVDASKMFLFGTSAGAFHASTYLWKLSSEHARVAGFLCANLPAHFRNSDPGRSQTLIAYLGSDPSLVDAITMRKASRDTTPCLLLVSDHDLEAEVTKPMEELADVWPVEPKPERVVMAGHNHFSPAKVGCFPPSTSAIALLTLRNLATGPQSWLPARRLDCSHARMDEVCGECR